MLSLNFKNNTQELMFKVIISLIPAIVYKLYISSWLGAFAFISIILTALLTEVFLAKLLKIKYNLFDFSSLITAILLFLSLSANLPWFVYAFASFSAIGLAKSIYGGFAKNIFNPAMVGWCFVMLSFPQYITKYVNISAEDFSFLQAWLIHINLFNIDTLSQATPLTEFKKAGVFLSEQSEIITLNILILLGGLYLLASKVIRITLPLFLVIGVILGMVIFNFKLNYTSLEFFLYSPFILGAFYIITDPVSSPSTVKGQALYATVIGFISILIASLGVYPIGLAFAVILGNGFMFIFDELFIKEVSND